MPKILMFELSTNPAGACNAGLSRGTRLNTSTRMLSYRLSQWAIKRYQPESPGLRDNTEHSIPKSSYLVDIAYRGFFWYDCNNLWPRLQTNEKRVVVIIVRRVFYGPNVRCSIN